MHSALWHESNKNILKSNRIYFEINIQNINDINTKYNIIGKRKKIFKLPFDKKNIFSNSRVTRIIKLKKRVINLEKKLEKFI